jgi:Peptidase family M28
MASCAPGARVPAARTIAPDMEATRARPRITHRRRRGSVEQPINDALVRGALLLLAPPLLILAFTIARPGPLPAPALPPSFDGASATALASELAQVHPNRVPGSSGAADAARWFSDKLALYGLKVTDDSWDQRIPGLGRVRLHNLSTVVAGATPAAIVFVAHRDNSRGGPGANDDASGTATLIELARGYARLGSPASRPQPQHTLIFVSSDGGAYGGYGAERFARTSPLRKDVVAVVSLDGLASSVEPRLVISGSASRSPAPALLRTADMRIAGQLGHAPLRPGWLVQLADLGIPFGYGEQAPFLAHRISAIRIATADDAHRASAADVPERLDPQRFAQLGRAAETLLGSLDAGPEHAGGTNGYVYLGERIVRGWAIQLVLVAALVPFLVGVIDLFARSRRRGLALHAAWRGLRARFGLWLWIAGVAAAGALTGVFPRDSVIPPPPDSPAIPSWSAPGVIVLGLLVLLGWTRARRRLVQGPEPSDDEALAGYVVALVALGGVAVATALVSPYGLVFVLPSLYAWLWLPQLQHRGGWRRDVSYGVGLIGPTLALVVIATQLDLGIDTPLYVVSLITLGFVPWTTVIVLLAWATVAAQLGALAAGRYVPLGQRNKP